MIKRLIFLLGVDKHQNKAKRRVNNGLLARNITTSDVNSDPCLQEA